MGQFSEFGVVRRDGNIEASDEGVGLEPDRDSEDARGVDLRIICEVEVEERFGFGQKLSQGDGALSRQTRFREKKAFERGVDSEGGAQSGDLKKVSGGSG